MSRHATRAVRRAPIIAVLGAALVAGGLVDRSAARSAPVAGATQLVQPVPAAAPAGAYSSSWFCAGASTGTGTFTPGQVVLANAGSAPVSARVSLVAATAPGGSEAGSAGLGSAPVQAVTVPAEGSVSVPETVPGAAWTGAIVDVDGGAVGVTQVIDSPLGRTASPCATSGSSRWYLPSGQTRINAAETVLLLNPYPTDSIVDLSFTTDQGVEAPEEFQGLDVPPGGLVAVPLAAHLRRRAFIATSVSARNGNVVAWASEIVLPPAKGQPLVGTPAASAALADPAYPVPGVSVILGAPSAGTSWVWPDGLAGNGIDEQYVIYNPGPRAADVRLSVGLQQGTAEPFDISVGPFQVVQEVSEQQARIPAGAAHTASLLSVNGVPVVASRTVAALSAPVAGSGLRNGIGQMLGERLSARHWLLAGTFSDSHHAAVAILYNPGTGPAQVTFSVPGAPGGGPGDGTVTVGPGQRVVEPLPAGGSDVLRADATAAVYVEADVYGTGTSGYGLSSAIPLS